MAFSPSIGHAFVIDLMQQMLVYMYNLDARPVQMGIEKSTVALCTSINVKQRRTHLLKTVTVAKETSRDFQNA